MSSPLPWQTHQWDSLCQQFEAGRLPHGLLLAGPTDIGKAHFALALARLLLCASPQERHNCGSCHACELSAAGTHGDLCWLQPEEKSRVIKIDQVRQAVAFTGQKANFGERKVVVLYPADRMNTNAANALLKALEEPSADTYLILVCHGWHGLPATIRSRCQIHQLSMPPTEQSLEWLQEITGDRRQSETLLQLAGGRPMLAADYFNEEGIEAKLQTRKTLIGVLDGSLPLAAANLPESGNASDFLLQLQQVLRELLRAQPPERLCSCGGRTALQLDEELTRLRAAVNSGANPNPQLLVDGWLARCRRKLGTALRSDSMD